jgi:hypothetical protein
MPKPLKILKTDNQKLSNSIENQNWSKILELTDVNKATQYFTSTLNNLFNQPKKPGIDRNIHLLKN